jgi:hypothetical protein
VNSIRTQNWYLGSIKKVSVMSGARSWSTSSFTQKEEERREFEPRSKEQGTLRAVDVLGVERAALIVVPVYTKRSVSLETPVRSYTPQPVRPQRRRVRPAIREAFTEEERARLRALDQAIVEACTVFSRAPMPRPADRMTMAWEFTRANPFTDYAADKTQTRPARPSGAAVDRAEWVFEVVFALKAEDEFAAFLIVARASSVAWKNIIAADPKRRSRGRLVVHRDNALARMLEIAADRGLVLI